MLYSLRAVRTATASSTGRGADGLLRLVERASTIRATLMPFASGAPLHADEGSR